jgi:diacylglycerol kinase family enzyme
MRVALVVNPFATRVSEERLAEVRKELEQVAELDVLLTERPGHATELVTVPRGGAEAVVVFSGTAASTRRERARVGRADRVLPGGGTSVLSRALGLPAIPSTPRGRWRTRCQPAGRADLARPRQRRRFAFAAGVGLPADVAGGGRSRPRDDGRRPSDRAFAWAIVRELVERRGRLEPQLEIEGYGRAAAAFVANGSPYTYAGRLPLPIAREAEFGRGLDLIAPVEVAPLALPSVAARVLSGHASGRRFLREHDLDRIEIRCDVPLPPRGRRGPRRRGASRVRGRAGCRLCARLTARCGRKAGLYGSCRKRGKRLGDSSTTWLT